MTTWLKCAFVFVVLIVISLVGFSLISIQTFRQSIDPAAVREIASSFMSFDGELPQKYVFQCGLSSFPGGALLIDDDKDKTVFMFFISPMDENEGNAQAIIDDRIAGASMSPINKLLGVRELPMNVSERGVMTVAGGKMPYVISKVEDADDPQITSEQFYGVVEVEGAQKMVEMTVHDSSGRSCDCETLKAKIQDFTKHIKAFR